MPVEHNKKIIFIHIPKTGGTSIINGLFNNGLTHNKQNLIGLMISLDGNWRRSSHCTAEEINTIFPNIFDTYRVVTVVRNPFDRMVSEFYHLVRHKIRHPVIGNVYDLNFNEFIFRVYNNFQEIEKIQSYPDEDYFIHFLPQSRFLKINNIFINDIKIYRFEKFEEIEKDFNLLEKKNVNNIKEQKHYSLLYNLDSRKMIEEIYSEDLQIFDYSFEVKK